MTDLENAKRRLPEGYTAVLCKDTVTHTATKRGVAPLLDWLESQTALQGFSAADKVVGKAAAMLYVLLGVKEVYADVMSEQAEAVFNRHGIACSYTLLVPMIRNRTNTGFCPMEQATAAIDDPHEALRAIKTKLAELKNSNR
ncbi:MAG: DUF1893 domain-containing protein [Clostridia bacterium]|nr:DUF1893 domain-containing protein [Clostridia bacterium]